MECPVLAVLNGRLNNTDTHYPSVVHVECDVGYHAQRYREIDVRCSANASWTLTDDTMIDVTALCARK